MKALTLTAPWAYAITTFGKRVENRTWRPPASLVGQRIAIHAGATWKEDDAWDVYDTAPACALCGPDFPVTPQTRGAVVCTAILVRVRLLEDIPEAERTPWHVGPWCWELADVQLLTIPVPAKGRLGLWDWDGAEVTL